MRLGKAKRHGTQIQLPRELFAIPYCTFVTPYYTFATNVVKVMFKRYSLTV